MLLDFMSVQDVFGDIREGNLGVDGLYMSRCFAGIGEITCLSGKSDLFGVLKPGRARSLI